jgi:hypothetical protein
LIDDFENIVCAIEESKNLNELSVYELSSSLMAHEQRNKLKKKESLEEALQAKVVLEEKALYVQKGQVRGQGGHSRGQCRGEMGQSRKKLARTRKRPRWQRKQIRCRLLQLWETWALCSGLLGREESRKQSQIR